MSDDDGMMLVNFTTGDNGGYSKPARQVKVIGGKWKDRRKLKMRLEGKSHVVKRSLHDDQETSSSVDGGGSADKEHQAKRPTRREHTINAVDSAPVPAHNNSTRSGPIQINSQRVSSLFTSNREITTSFDTSEQVAESEVTPSNAPLLLDSFESLGITSPLVSHLSEKMHVSKPTRIQKLAIPNFLVCRNDLFIHAQTGSGKTLAFLLPIFQKILSMEEQIDRHSGCFAMIIAPTRELASQIYNVASTLAGCCHYLVPCLLVGGERKKSEKARLRKGANFIIGTPGRILDHLQNTKVIKEQLSYSLRYVILDEGDKLMELGFEETLTSILDIIHNIPCESSKFPVLPTRIMHVLCSATKKGTVAKLGNIALKDYKLISSGSNSADMNTVPDQLLQRITIVPPKLRLVTLCGALSNLTKKQSSSTTTMRTIVFLSCSDSVDFHFDVFSAYNDYYRNLLDETVRLLAKRNTALPCLSADHDPNVIFYKLHGSLSQKVRTATLKHFSSETDATSGKHLIMFCTDVASRGLDLPHVSTVVEMDPPFSVEDHLHRVGRTARAGVNGESLLFLLPGEEEGYVEYIKPYHPQGYQFLKFDKDILKPAFQDSNIQKSDNTVLSDVHASWDNNATTWHLNVERRILENPDAKQLAHNGYTSHIRAYATHLSKEKLVFNIKCLHLGHLAKAFALRERPKAISSARASNSRNNNKNNNNNNASSNDADSKTKMLRMARMVVKQNNNEFNY
ncbi:putative ATP-dependent RNA helicase Ecym_6354 [Eremothecium cymbalariae DBVPG|uniref:ATP-dependent RNA helicase n=1 Tax=Eremothecium cymbalariae (strain CBS 270.75 / DBVPG 7215 / KCTC 17166 / NRRL Y-17582) TaxID=931890 RepID=G8JUF0_ERECY|nr:hypothetical protein Ecym_6354 [Eremothecium cymbalariae DBVPG\